MPIYNNSTSNLRKAKDGQYRFSDADSTQLFNYKSAARNLECGYHIPVFVKHLKIIGSNKSLHICRV